MKPSWLVWKGTYQGRTYVVNEGMGEIWLLRYDPHTGAPISERRVKPRDWDTFCRKLTQVWSNGYGAM